VIAILLIEESTDYTDFADSPEGFSFSIQVVRTIKRGKTVYAKLS